MEIELGGYGVWCNSRIADADLGIRLEAAGFGALWLGAADDRLALAGRILDATETLVVATGIVNIWRIGAPELAAAYHELAARHGDRLLLGIGTGHPETAGQQAAAPYDELVAYLDELDAAGVPREKRAVAALGPRVLQLAAARSAGAHPYLVTPEHTRLARAQIGPDALLAPEQGVVFSTDAAVARGIGREWLARYLGLVNYRNNLLRLGFTVDDLETSSDRLVDEIVAWGDDAAIRSRIDAHLEAGADHVPIQILGEDRDYERLAALLGL